MSDFIIEDHVTSTIFDNLGLKIFALYGAPHGGPSATGHEYRVFLGSDVVRHISFQNGPIPTVGANGLTNEALLAILIHRTECLDSLYPCEENKEGIRHMKAALAAFEARTANRLKRGVEGTYKA